METIEAYEFYFDTPVVVSDTFFVGYHTLGVDGRQHPQCTFLPGHCSVTLRDAAGHTFHQTSFSGTSTLLDTRNLTSGTYSLTLADPETSATRKLIIE